MTIKCERCGCFLSYHEMEAGTAKFHFVPDSEFGPEETSWTCAKCVAIDERLGVDIREKVDA